MGRPLKQYWPWNLSKYKSVYDRFDVFQNPLQVKHLWIYSTYTGEHGSLYVYDIANCTLWPYGE